MKVLPTITRRIQNSFVHAVAFLIFWLYINPRYQSYHCQSCALVHNEVHCLINPCPWKEFGEVGTHSPQYWTKWHEEA